MQHPMIAGAPEKRHRRGRHLGRETGTGRYRHPHYRRGDNQKDRERQKATNTIIMKRHVGDRTRQGDIRRQGDRRRRPETGRNRRTEI